MRPKHLPRALLLTCALILSAPSATSAQSATFSVSARAQAAIELPSAAIELRAAGVPAPEVRTALVSVRTHHVPAPEVRVLFRRSVQLVHVHGPLPHFGGFVRVQIGEGLRGPRLVEALRVEHRHHRHPGLHKGHALDTPGHRRHGHAAPNGPPGHAGMSSIRVRQPGPGMVRVRGPGGPGMAGVRVRGPGPSGMAVRVRGPSGGGMAVRVRGPGGGGGGRGGMR